VGRRLRRDEETILSSQLTARIIHRQPAAMKAFYMEPDPVRPDLALGFDMLASDGYGEIVGGGERISSYDLLLKRLREHHLPRRLSSGTSTFVAMAASPRRFGMGLERVVAGFVD